ncbi:hypothetical protein HYH03_012147 [Edaphochlamys debaryana]|uniref:ATP-dependent helicase HrpB n=1 Tax=Edaphochlamys debaryana TaxID=47281 RepID=A0A835XTC6_9CHLO|nr:hypothetical protein HYH03_012147 [Edaphochlamys debaryana]|eukprot:KAG2489315.1 hypothetical protein HYH03_012147 [Edaphochlamys debaryana]
MSATRMTRGGRSAAPTAAAWLGHTPATRPLQPHPGHTAGPAAPLRLWPCSRLPSGGAAVADPRRPAVPPRAAVVASAAAAQAVRPDVLKIADGLPIRECLEEVLVGLDRGSGMVLQAPPGAGKTTVVPLAMLAHGPEYLAGGQKILVLEPRRVAAKGAARRMAASLGEPAGGRVGYRVRLETKVSSATRIEVVTEGILLRRLQSDPELEGVGAIVFDEFHERNLDADVALALCLDVQRLARPELRLLVMSATLGGGLGDRVRALMGEAQAGGGGGQGPEVRLVVSEGRSFPVSTHHLGTPDPTERHALERAVADAVAQALRESSGDRGGAGGDVLAFLPGVGEIQRAERFIEEDGTAKKYGVRLMQLYGNMAPDAQDEVLRPSKGGAKRRRVILATPIAESSVTIEGVTAVVDCGLRRVPRYDPSTAVNRLATVRISEASADQRRGRAGRTAPGRCYRLWSERDPLPSATSEPEIASADLAPTCLELALWGSPDGAGLPWLDPPPRDLVDAGVELLKDLGALEPSSLRPTPHGRLLARLGTHPRWGQAVLRGAALGCVELAAVVANMLGGERDLLRGQAGGRSADLMLRLEALARDDQDLDRASASRVLQGARAMAALATATTRAQQARAAAPPPAAGAAAAGRSALDDEDEAVAAAVAAAGAGPMESADPESGPADAASLDGADDDGEDEAPAAVAAPAAPAAPSKPFDVAWRDQMVREGLVGALVAAAYPDRIAERKDRSNTRAAFTLSSGQVVRLPSDSDPLSSAPYLAVAEIGGVARSAAWRRDGGGNDMVRAAAGLSLAAIEGYLKEMIQERDEVFWASSSKSVLARRRRCLGRLVLSERSTPISDAAALPALLQGFKEMGGVRGVGLSKETEAWRQRAVWLRRQAQAGPSAAAKALAELPDLSDEGLLASAPQWLAPHLAGVRRKGDMLKLDWGNILRSLLSWEQRQAVDREAPSHLTLPTGTQALVDYSGDTPVVRCRMQEVFGLAEAPRLAGGRIPLTLELLTPAQRPAAVTADLASFWANSYPEVRKQLRGEYPRHVWPENPLEAEATRLTKRALAAAEAAKAAAEAAKGTAAGAGKGGAKGGAGAGQGAGGKGKAGGGKKK